MRTLLPAVLALCCCLPAFAADRGEDPGYTFGDQTLVVNYRVVLGSQATERRTVIKSASIKSIGGKQYLVGQGINGWKENALIIIPMESVLTFVGFKDVSKLNKLLADKEEKFEMSDLP